MLKADGLHEIAHGPDLERLDCKVVVGGRENDTRCLNVQGSQMPHHLDPIHPGHPDIQKNQIDRSVLQSKQGFPTVTGLGNLRSGQNHLKQSPETYPGQSFVVCDENLRHEPATRPRLVT